MQPNFLIRILLLLAILAGACCHVSASSCTPVTVGIAHQFEAPVVIDVTITVNQKSQTASIQPGRTHEFCISPGPAQLSADTDGQHLADSALTISEGHAAAIFLLSSSDHLVFVSSTLSDNAKQSDLDPLNAWINFVVADCITESRNIYGYSTLCSDCAGAMLFADVPSNSFTPWKSIYAAFNYRVQMQSILQQNNNISAIELGVGYRGIYSVALYQDGQATQAIVITLASQDNGTIPLIVALSVLVSLAGLAVTYSACTTETQEKAHKEETQPLIQAVNNTDVSDSQLRPADSSQPEKKDHKSTERKSGRVLSLDTFRGISLVIMIFVNYGGGGYWFFDHSRWNGLTVADLVFPWFMWIMGTSAYLAYNSAKNKGVTAKKALPTCYKRSAKLIALGLFLNNGVVLAKWRFPGVLQYFGISYGILCTVLWLVPELKQNEHGDSLRDIKPFAFKWAVALMLPFFYIVFQYGLEVPGCPQGYIGPGGLSQHGRHFNCTGGAHRLIDEKLWGVNHFYDDPTCKDVYDCLNYDPEGTLGSLSAAFMVFLGMQAGRIITVFGTTEQRLKRLIAWGVLCGAIGGGLCGFSKDNGFMPLNKNLWSLSFVLSLSGMAYIFLAVLYVIVDIKKIWLGMPFRAVGMNSILIYAGHETLQGVFPFTIQGSNTYGFQLFQNLLGASMWAIIAYYWYSIKFFVTV